MKYLTKIEYARINNSYDFIIRFHFDENPYFKNKIITKQFNMMDDETPIKSIGTVIEWKEGMNLTRKKVLKVLYFIFKKKKKYYLETKKQKNWTC